MKNYCELCDDEFTPTGTETRFCPACARKEAFKRVEQPQDPTGLTFISAYNEVAKQVHALTASTQTDLKSYWKKHGTMPLETGFSKASLTCGAAILTMMDEAREHDPAKAAMAILEATRKAVITENMDGSDN